jgi:hypothetical protein
MTELNLKKITEELIDTFLYAGEISLELREKGLIKERKLWYFNLRIWYGNGYCSQQKQES